MNLKDQLRDALAALPPFAAGREVVELADGPRRLRCELGGLDTLGCSVEQLAVAADRLSAASVDQLRNISSELTRKLTYLLEPVALLEVDADRCSVQMRSSPPQKDDDGTRYYELLVERGGQVSLCRYQKQPGQPRCRVPAQLTREVLLRLAGDFERAVS